MCGKLEEAWEGPCEVLEQTNAVNVRLGMPGKGRKKKKVVHINHLVPYTQQTARVLRLVVTAEEAEEGQKVEVLQGEQLTGAQLQDVERLKERWKGTLTEVPGKTKVLTHSIDTGDSKSVRLHPYLISPAKLVGVKTELQAALSFDR